MNAVTVPKSYRSSQFEGIVLTATVQGLPTFASAVLLMKIFGDHQGLADKGVGTAIFVLLAAFAHAAFTAWLGPKFPRFFKHAYEPLFFDTTLSFQEKLARWRTQPTASLQLMTAVIMMSLLVVVAVSVG
jgi:hypothetical protein